jgi:hypothetical protein
MGCEHNTGWLDSACALCKNNELLESTQKENRRIADQNEKDAKANREATQSQILSNEKLAREAADRAKELAKDAADRAEIAERAERERHEEQMRLENAKLNIEGAKAEFDSADKAWNKNQSKKTAGMYALTRRKYYHAIGKDPGFKPEPIPAIFYDYLRFPCEISDEKSVISPKEIEDEWNNAQFLSHVASLDELFSPNDPLSKTINSDAAKMLKHVQDTLHSKKNMALLEKSKKAKIEEQRIAEEQRIKEERIAEAQRIKEERIAAEKWEAERSIRESAEVQRKKEKPIRIISLVSTISVLLLPLLFSNARPVWAPVLFLLGVKIGRIHISQFVLPNFSGARENWIAKIRIFQINTAGLVVVIPPTVTSVYFSYLLFAAAYKNEIVAIIYSVIVGTIVILYLGERNILRLNGKQSIVDFAITLILELYNYLRYFPRNILKMFGI